MGITRDFSVLINSAAVVLQAVSQDVKANLFLSQGQDGENFRSSIYCAGINGIRQASNVHQRAQSLTRAALKSALIVMPMAVKGEFYERRAK